MRQLLTMVGADVRQRVRDKSVPIFGLLVPIALMSVMNLVFSDTEDIELDPVTVAIEAADDDELAPVLTSTLEQLETVEVTVEQVEADEARAHVNDERADLGVVIDGATSAALMQGDSASVALVEGAGSGMETDIVISVTEAVAERFISATTAAHAGAEAGLTEQDVGMVAEQVAQAPPALATTEGQTASEQLDEPSTMVAGQAGLFLLFTVGFGVLALINEREQGTLRRLRSMPMRPGLIVGAKAISSYLLGVGATAVLLGVGSWLFGVSFGSVPLVALLVLCVVAAATSLMFVVARIARTAEQAGITQAILAVTLGMFGGAFFQVSGEGIAGVLLDVNPIGAFTRGLGITAGGGTLADLVVPIVSMLGFAVVATLASRLVPDRGAEL